MDPLENTLSNVIGNQYDEIKNNFIIGSKKQKIIFDNDVFSDTFIKCYDTLGDKPFEDSKCVIKYYWASFLNNIRKKFRKPKYKPIVTELNENIDMIDEESDTEIKCCICDLILDSVYEKFGDRLYNAWYLHFIENKTYDYILSLPYYKDLNLHDEFRRIMTYIRKKLVNENAELKELISNLQE